MAHAITSVRHAPVPPSTTSQTAIANIGGSIAPYIERAGATETLQNSPQKIHNIVWPWFPIELASKCLDPATTDFDVVTTRAIDLCVGATAVFLLGDFNTAPDLAQGEVCRALEVEMGRKLLSELVTDVQGLYFKPDTLMHFLKRDQRWCSAPSYEFA